MWNVEGGYMKCENTYCSDYSKQYLNGCSLIQSDPSTCRAHKSYQERNIIVDDLKCCGNCKDINFELLPSIICERDNKSTMPEYCCSLWTWDNLSATIRNKNGGKR